MVDTHFHTAGAPVDYSSPTAFSNSQTAGYSILGQSVDPVNAPGAALVGGLGENSANASVDTCNLFGGGKRKRKAKRSRKLRRSNKSRLSSKSRKSRSKSRSKVKKLSKKSLRKSKRNKRKSLR